MSELRYTAGDTTCVGYVAYPKGAGPHPVVIVTPAFGGLDDFARGKADWLASLGYIGFAVDYYGEGRTARDEAHASELMHVLQADRATLLVRMQSALDTARALPDADANRVAAIGFCFGGKAVLDLARSGASLSGVVPFHGIFDAPPSGCSKMNTSVLVLHGWDDPLAKPDQAVGLATELTEHCDDWQILAFGHTSHAFTNPNAQNPKAGMAYVPSSNDRAFAAMQAFLTERFAQS
ncbi:dienelactone hydrolase family protein [Litoreibacter janthinus]|uniref:Dienelactone hydrolase n=1 Tax=Litoreibacter janthinus TaxID=670154 RepID=A0A1I6GRV3_9RHOB|nr:dienelactone hydrolase family protein [Litoreibacter janthinus]SFR44910.1 Dienelactone hydrolase [Litoreibacter janthinus]